MADEGNIITFNPAARGEIELRQALQYISILLPKSTFNAGRVPVATDDIAQGWKIGSWWIMTTGTAALLGIYRCFDNTEGAAKWHKMVDVLLNEGGASDPSGGATPDPVVDNQVTRFDQTAGKIQGSTVFIDDAGNITGSKNHDDIVFIAAGSKPFSSSGVTAQTSNYTATLGDDIILCDGTFSVTLPTAIGNKDKEFVIKNIGTGVITVDGNGSETIDGSATVVMAIQYLAHKIVSDNANWWIL